MGVKRTNISNWETEVSSPSLDQVKKIANYFGILIDDLVSKDLGKVNQIGQGILIENYTIGKPNSVDLLSKKRESGKPNKVRTYENLIIPERDRLDQFEDRESIERYQKLLLPGITGKARTFKISGTSMFPTLRDGDILVCIPADINSIEDGKVYAVISKDLTINAKYAYTYIDGILMVPANRAEYHPIIIQKKDIVEIWKAVLRLTSDLPDFADVGGNQDMEKKIEQLEYFIRKMFPDYGDLPDDSKK